MKPCPDCGTNYPDALAVCPKDGATLPEIPGRVTVPADPLIGTTIDGRYRVESRLGEGGMGVVYAVRHILIDKRFAIKVLKSQALADETAGQRFIVEAKSASKIGHANIVDITDFGVLADGSAYFVMEFLEGETLASVLARGPVAPVRAISIAAQVARGLNAAHQKGIVHRDLKPDNIFLTEREGQPDVVKVVDFGIAKVQERVGSQRLTQAGMVLGTPEYMSPEQATGKEIDHRVDEYALGCILYEMLTGKVPFRGENSVATLTMHVFERPVPPRKRRPDLGIPPRLEALVLKAMARKPDDRFAGMKELLSALDGAAMELTIPPGFVRAGAREALSSLRPRPAGERTRRAHARRATLSGLLWVGAGAGGALLLVIGGVAVLRGGRAASPAESGAGDGAGRASEVADGAGPRAGAGAGAANPPARVRLTLRSNPKGAQVSIDGAIAGATPLVIERVAAASPLRIAFRLAGHRDAVRELVPDADRDLEVALTARVPERRRPVARPGPAAPRRPPATDLQDPFR